MWVNAASAIFYWHCLAGKRQECVWSALASALSFLPDVSFAEHLDSEFRRHFSCKDLLGIWNIRFYYLVVIFQGTIIPKGIFKYLYVHFVPLFHQISENGTLITQLGLRCHHILRNTSCFLTKCVSRFFCQSQGQFCTKLCSFSGPF